METTLSIFLINFICILIGSLLIIVVIRLFLILLDYLENKN